MVTILRSSFRNSIVAALLLGALLTVPRSSAQPVQLWLTTPDRTSLFARASADLKFTDSAPAGTIIAIDAGAKRQSIDGFGYCLTGGSALHLHRMSAAARAQLLEELFGTGPSDIGVSCLRLTLGASDLDERVFSYDDLAPGETDPTLAHFTLDHDRADLLPVLKEILGVAPGLMLLASPWSPPVWMKTNGDTHGGSLKPDCYDVYARYFVRYLQAMQAEGITVNALTVQNEPLNGGNNPSLVMTAAEQREFVKHNLGPALKAAGLKTRIIVYDHNADHPDYPLTILSDPAAAQYVDGSAFHLYRGPIDALSQVHRAHPEKNLYFTEQWVGAPGNLPADLNWHVKNLIIGATRNWCRTVLEWNLSSDPHYRPHTDRGGCDRCLGAVTIDGDKVTRNPAYYIIAHAAKFVRPGSVRLDSNSPETLPNVAFHTPDGKTALIVLNSGSASADFSIGFAGKAAAASLPPGAVGTFVW